MRNKKYFIAILPFCAKVRKKNVSGWYVQTDDFSVSIREINCSKQLVKKAKNNIKVKEQIECIKRGKKNIPDNIQV